MKNSRDMPMQHREPPDNDHDTLLALWYAIIGTNGSGIMERVRRLEERGRNRWLVIKDIFISGGILAALLIYYLDKLP